MPPPGPPLLLVFLLSFGAAQDLLVHKCCPEDMQLSRNLSGCVVAPEDRSEGSFPWWMDADSPAMDQSLAEALRRDPGRVLLGGPRPCDWSETKYWTSHSAELRAHLANGSLLVAAASGDPLALEPQDFCVDRVDHAAAKNPRGTFVYLACPCRRVLCVRKCCRRAKRFVLHEFRKSLAPVCEEDEPDPWTPVFFDGDSSRRPLERSPPLVMLDGKIPTCREGHETVLLNHEGNGGNDSFWIFPNGSALVEDFGFGVPYPADAFCGERTRLASGALVDNVLFCHAVAREVAGSVSARVYGSLFAVGSVFLALTLLTYGLLPDLRNSPHAKALMSHVAAMLLASVFLAVGQLRAAVPRHVCYTVALLVQFTFLAAFFWLNVMCIDIAWAFSGFRSLQGTVHEQDKKKFLYYSLYAWLSPVVISVVTAVMEFEESIPNYLLKPDFGVKMCWFHTKLATLAYFYGPMAALLIVNLFLFLFTAYRILKVQRETAILNTTESIRHDNSTQDKKRLVLYLKLFCLMGVTWIMEIVSWAHGVDEYYYVTDLINLLRGFFIFLIFCCKAKVLRLLQKKMAGRQWVSRLLVKMQPSDRTGTRKSSSNCTQMTNLNLNSSECAQARSKKRASSSVAIRMPLAADVVRSHPEQEGRKTTGQDEPSSTNL